MQDRKLQHYIDNADHYKAIENIEHYLFDGPYPWDNVIDCKPGGMYRLGVPVDVDFDAVHDCGLSFRWSVSLEPPSANGTGSLQIDSDKIQDTLGQLPANMQEKFAKCFTEHILKLREESANYLTTARQKSRLADFFVGLATSQEGAKNLAEGNNG